MIKTPLPLSAGQTTYISSGILETLQETIIATRNAESCSNKISQQETDTSTILKYNKKRSQ